MPKEEEPAERVNADAGRPIEHPIIAGFGLIATGALVVAVLTGLVKGLAAQK